MKRSNLSWLAFMPGLIALAALYTILTWGDGRNIGAILAGAASIITTVVVVSIFIMQLNRDSRTIDSIAEETKSTLSTVTQMEATMDNFKGEIALIERQTKMQQQRLEDSEAEKRILEENAQLRRDYLHALTRTVQLMQENQELKAQLNQEKKQNTDSE